MAEIAEMSKNDGQFAKNGQLKNGEQRKSEAVKEVLQNTLCSSKQVLKAFISKEQRNWLKT